MVNSILVMGLPPSVICCLRSLTARGRIFQRELKRELTEPNWRLTVQKWLEDLNESLEKKFPGQTLVLHEKNEDRRLGRRNEVVYCINDAFILAVADNEITVSLRGAAA